MSRPRPVPLRRRLAFRLVAHGGRRWAWSDAALGLAAALGGLPGQAGWRVAALAGAVPLAAAAAGLYEHAAWSGPWRLVSRAAAAGLAWGIVAALLPVSGWGTIWPRAGALAAILAAALAAPRLVLWTGLRRRPLRLGVAAGEEIVASGLKAALAREPAPLWVLSDAVEPRPAPPSEVGVDVLVSDGPGPSQPGIQLLPAEAHAALGQAVPPEVATLDWLAARDRRRDRWRLLRRWTGAALAAAAIVVTLPLALLSVLIVAAGRDGPILYTQLRVGRGGRVFRILKLRTMRVDAESAGPRWAEPDDPRRTRAGRILRRLRLDELPQLVNVVRGEMALVGPRPERPELAAGLAPLIPGYAWRHRVPPGLTGWAQLHHPYGSSLEDARRKLELDLYYLAERSFALDLAILARTAGRLVQGAR